MSGRWPHSCGMRQARAYVDGLIDSDASRMDGVMRNATRMRALMRSYARHTSTQASQAPIAADPASMTPQCRRTGERLPGCSRTCPCHRGSPRMESSASLQDRCTHQSHAALRRSLDRPGGHACYTGWAPVGHRDLRIAARVLVPQGSVGVCGGRGRGGLLLSGQDGSGGGRGGGARRWSVGTNRGQAGCGQIDDAAPGLRSLAERVDVARMGEPSFLAVVTAGEAAYRRGDGVLVIPLACPGP